MTPCIILYGRQRARDFSGILHVVLTRAGVLVFDVIMLAGVAYCIKLCYCHGIQLLARTLLHYTCICNIIFEHFLTVVPTVARNSNSNNSCIQRTHKEKCDQLYTHSHSRSVRVAKVMVDGPSTDVE